MHDEVLPSRWQHGRFDHLSALAHWLGRIVEGQTDMPTALDLNRVPRTAKQDTLLFREDMNMSTRTTQSIVHFSAPFALRGVDEVQPPGDYAIDQDEDLVD